MGSGGDTGEESSWSKQEAFLLSHHPWFLKLAAGLFHGPGLSIPWHLGVEFCPGQGALYVGCYEGPFKVSPLSCWALNLPSPPLAPTPGFTPSAIISINKH